jgi:hypothetical protein
MTVWGLGEEEVIVGWRNVKQVWRILKWDFMKT